MQQHRDKSNYDNDKGSSNFNFRPRFGPRATSRDARTSVSPPSPTTNNSCNRIAAQPRRGGPTYRCTSGCIVAASMSVWQKSPSAHSGLFRPRVTEDRTTGYLYKKESFTCSSLMWPVPDTRHTATMSCSSCGFRRGSRRRRDYGKFTDQSEINYIS